VKNYCAYSLLVLGALSSGCSLVYDASNNISAETHRNLEDKVEGLRNRRWAKGVWLEVAGQDPQHAYSKDYEQGFIEGFTDYLAAGGTGEPPALPPSKYWKPKYESPEGYQAIEDWFAGFRHGATVAREGGYRRWIILPSPLVGGPTDGYSAPVGPPDAVAPMPRIEGGSRQLPSTDKAPKLDPLPAKQETTRPQTGPKPPQASPAPGVPLSRLPEPRPTEVRREAPPALGGEMECDSCGPPPVIAKEHSPACRKSAESEHKQDCTLFAEEACPPTNQVTSLADSLVSITPLLAEQNCEVGILPPWESEGAFSIRTPPRRSSGSTSHGGAERD
jgi:hypothetical protein